MIRGIQTFHTDQTAYQLSTENAEVLANTWTYQSEVIREAIKITE